MNKFTFWMVSGQLLVVSCHVGLRLAQGTFTSDLGMYAFTSLMWWLTEYLWRSRPTVAWITGDDSYPYITATKPSEYSQELVVK